MKLVVKREYLDDQRAVGRLSIDGREVCYTLEDTVREQPGVAVALWKREGETAIPAGTYKVILDYSNRFRCELPHVLDVPGFTGVRLHKGNTEEDTEGCLLLGLGKTKDNLRIHTCQPALDAVMGSLEAAYLRNEDVTLEIS